MLTDELGQVSKPNQCGVCQAYRLDGGPPALHRCLACGYQGGEGIHGDCPGCAVVGVRRRTAAERLAWLDEVAAAADLVGPLPAGSDAARWREMSPAARELVRRAVGEPFVDEPHAFAPLTFGAPGGPVVADWCGYGPAVGEVCGRPAGDLVHAV